MRLQVELTESFGADMFVFEFVVSCVGVDHDPLHAVAAELLLWVKHRREMEPIETHSTHTANHPVLTDRVNQIPMITWYMVNGLKVF